MADLKLFLKGNKKTRDTVKFAATSTLCDEDGKPLEWELKPISTDESEKIREACAFDVPITGKKGQYRTKLNTSKYLSMMIAASVVFPNLYSKELQDSYGVATPEELVKKMVDIPAEYDDFAKKVQEINGFDVSMDDLVEEAKN